MSYEHTHITHYILSTPTPKIHLIVYSPLYFLLVKWTSKSSGLLVVANYFF